MREIYISTNSDNDYSPNQDFNVNTRTSNQSVLPQNSEFGTAKHTRTRTIRPSRHQDYVMN